MIDFFFFFLLLYYLGGMELGFFVPARFDRPRRSKESPTREEETGRWETLSFVLDFYRKMLVVDVASLGQRKQRSCI